MVPVATERLIASHQTPSGELTDEELEEEEVAAAWAADVLQLPSSLELDIRVRKGAEPLGKAWQAVVCRGFHSDESGDHYVLGCSALWFGRTLPCHLSEPMFLYL
jgi:hypothetical protein